MMSPSWKTCRKAFAIRKMKTPQRYSTAAKKYLEDLFDEGIRMNRKLTPEEAEERMRTARGCHGKLMFNPEERLSSRQIASFFSRIASPREKEKAKTSSSGRGKRATGDKKE